MTIPVVATTSPRRAVVWVARAVSYLVYGYVLLVELVLFLGFFLLLFGANPSSGFAEWVYRSLANAMEPFRGIFAPIELGTTGNDVVAVFETSVLFAMIVYGVVALALHAVIDWLSARIAKIERIEAVEAARARAETLELQRAEAIELDRADRVRPEPGRVPSAAGPDADPTS